MKKTAYSILVCGVMALMTACTPSEPKQSTETGTMPQIYPDYTNVTIPVNIAPMNFKIESKGEKFVVKATYGNTKKVFGADSEGIVTFSPKAWKEMTSAANGGSISYEIYAKQGNSWVKYNTFRQNVVGDSIDKYLTYRLIEPLYKYIGHMGIYQYDTETSQEKAIFDYRKNQISRDYDRTYCMNCHTSQRNNPGNRMFYVRGSKGGMMLTYNGETKLVNTKCGDMKYSTAYAQWHPTLPYIAATSENVRQSFASNDNKKIYQFDKYGDIVLYDIEKNEITNVFKTPNRIEGMLSWSPDGNYLYYCYTDTAITTQSSPLRQKYNIARIKFNADTKTFGNVEEGSNNITSSETIVNAVALDSSAAAPKINVDGKHMLFRMGKYGMYMQTNKTADIYIMDLETKKFHPLDSLNSPQADHFHDFSSTGRWISYESKKEDGNYAKVYFSYFDRDGVAHKPFAMPHENPLWDKELLKSYNCSEFTTCANDKLSKDYHTILDNDPLTQANYGDKIDSTSINGTSGASQVNGVGGASRVTPEKK